MNKLFAIVAASAFALASATSFAANDVNQAQATPAVKHTVVNKSDQAKKATVHKVKQAKKKHAKRSTKKARRAV
jgi:hypothetical protein